MDVISALPPIEPATILSSVASPTGAPAPTALFATLLAGRSEVGLDQIGANLPVAGTPVPHEAGPFRDDDEADDLPTTPDALPAELAPGTMPLPIAALPRGGSTSPPIPLAVTDPPAGPPRAESRSAPDRPSGSLPRSRTAEPHPISRLVSPPPAPLPTPPLATEPPSRPTEAGTPADTAILADTPTLSAETAPRPAAPIRMQASLTPAPTPQTASIAIAPPELRLTTTAPGPAMSASAETSAKPAPTLDRIAAPSLPPITPSTARRTDAPARPRPQTRAAEADTAPILQPAAPPPAPPAIGGDLGPLIAPREPAPTAPGQATASAEASHDFAAIVDRLVAARQAGSSVAGTTTVAHPEFGHVRLRLSERDGALGITLSSPDPGFVAVAETALRAAPAPFPMQLESNPQPTPPPAPSGESPSSSAQSASADARQSGGAFAREPADRRSATPSAPAESRTPAAKSGSGIYA